MTPILVQEAYRSYSTSRRISMLEEWHDVYPDIKDHIDFFAGWKSRTRVSDISCTEINKQLLKYFGREDSKDRVSREMASLAATKGDVASTYESLSGLRPLLMSAFTAGAIGFIFPPANHIIWAGSSLGQVSESGIDLTTIIVIHPMLAHALGTHINA